MRDLPAIHYVGILQAFAEKIDDDVQTENLPEHDQNFVYFLDLVMIEIANIISPISVSTQTKK